MPIHRPQRNWGCRIHETTLYGLAAVVLENELVRLTFLTGKGTDLVEFNYKPLDLDFAWLTPMGIRNPLALHSTLPDPVTTFLDYYPGGWQEIFPNAGAPSTWAGAKYGQHGEVSALPWDVEIIEDTADAVAVRCTVRGVRSPCTLRKEIWLRAGEAGPEFQEAATNDSPVPVDVMWGQHITFGPPFMVAGCRIATPGGLTAIPHGVEVGNTGRRVPAADPFAWPHGPGADGAVVDYSVVPAKDTPSELFYLTGFPGETAWYEITRPNSPLGMRVEWDATAFPYLWYWQEFGGTRGYPWYGRGYNIGLEPSAAYPTTGLADAVANGSAVRLGPGESKRVWLRASVVGGGR